MPLQRKDVPTYGSNAEAVELPRNNDPYFQMNNRAIHENMDDDLRRRKLRIATKMQDKWDIK